MKALRGAAAGRRDAPRLWDRVGGSYSGDVTLTCVPVPKVPTRDEKQTRRGWEPDETCWRSQATGVARSGRSPRWEGRAPGNMHAASRSTGRRAPARPPRWKRAHVAGSKEGGGPACRGGTDEKPIVATPVIARVVPLGRNGRSIPQ